MAKVRFYVDVPEYRIANYGLIAWMEPMNKSALPGIRRVAFDVELPPDVWKSFDVAAQVSNVHFPITDKTDPTEPPGGGE